MMRSGSLCWRSGGRLTAISQELRKLLERLLSKRISLMIWGEALMTASRTRDWISVDVLVFAGGQAAWTYACQL